MTYRLAAQRPLEADIQKAILSMLARHPKVSFAHRINSGAFAIGEGKSRRYVRASVKGHPDIAGVLKGGRALYIEVKRPGEHPTPDQHDFLNKAALAGALSFVARSIDDVIKTLDDA